MALLLYFLYALLFTKHLAQLAHVEAVLVIGCQARVNQLMFPWPYEQIALILLLNITERHPEEQAEGVLLAFPQTVRVPCCALSHQVSRAQQLVQAVWSLWETQGNLCTEFVRFSSFLTLSSKSSITQ